MIVLDTHIWVWWVHGDSALSATTRTMLDSAEQTGLGVSAISCWEVAKLVERGRLTLPCPVFDWIQQALRIPVFASSSFRPASALSPHSFRALFTATPPTKSSSRHLVFWMCLLSPWTPRFWSILMSGLHQQTPNHALQRTAPCVTAPAPRRPTAQEPRRAPVPDERIIYNLLIAL